MSPEFVFANFGGAPRAAYARLAVLFASLVLPFAKAFFSFHVLREVVVTYGRPTVGTPDLLALLVTDSKLVEVGKHGPTGWTSTCGLALN